MNIKHSISSTAQWAQIVDIFIGGCWAGSCSLLMWYRRCRRTLAVCWSQLFTAYIMTISPTVWADWAGRRQSFHHQRLLNIYCIWIIMWHLVHECVGLNRLCRTVVQCLFHECGVIGSNSDRIQCVCIKIHLAH